MINIRQSARGRDCAIRIPGICNRNPETTVLAHVRLIGLSGIGLKSPDIFGAFACSDCHAVVDGHKRSNFTSQYNRVAHLEGMIRTQAILLEEGLIHIHDGREG